MSVAPQTPSSRHDGKPITLIPVGLKEAGLDSPTFRAGFTHFSEQLDYLEKWLENYMRSVTRLSHEIGPFEGLINGFLGAVSSLPQVSEAILDHDYTLLAMKRYGEVAREFWTTTISGLKRMENNMVEPVRAFLQNDLRSFKEARKNLDQLQKQLENLQSRYSAQPKSKDVSSLREDAFQLHEARKSYLKASMDFAVVMPSLRMALDRMLVRIFSDQWRDMRIPREHISGSVGRCGNDIERVRGWSRELESGEMMFRRELQNARKQVEESAEIATRPSRDLEDYNFAPAPGIGLNAPSTTNRQSSNKGRIDGSEKQGWLNLRSVTGKPTKTTWLRRWFYVKNGTSGWLVQGSRSGGVEEGERIGVLLCSVRAVVSDDRRFCFEVKTKDSTTIVQADSQAELFDWIKAFETAKQKALQDTSTRDSNDLTKLRTADAAFSILPPTVPEFTASSADSGVQQACDETPNAGFDRMATLPIPGGDSVSNLASRSSFDVSTHRRSTANDKEGESGTSRIIQRLDLHRKSASGPQTGGNSSVPLPSSPTSGYSIASLVAASHNVIPVGPGFIPQPLPPEHPAARSQNSTTVKDLPMSTLAPNTLMNPPAPTNLSSTAVVVHIEKGAGPGPVDVAGCMASGIMANIWGSSNWGYLNRLEQGGDSSVGRSRVRSESTQAASSNENDRSTVGSPTSSPSYRQNHGLDDGAITQGSEVKQPVYPTIYAFQLKTQHAQFRLLFPQINQEEAPVLVFRAIWNLSDQQEFPGRVYVTAKRMYFYSNHLGLVLLSEIRLDSISEVTAAPGRDCDFVFLHFKPRDQTSGPGPGRITIKTYLEPLKLLQQRLNFLIRNSTTHLGLGLEEIIGRLIKIEQDDPNNSPSLESWEEVSMNTPLDDASLLNRRTSQKDHHDLRARVLVDGRLYGGASKPEGIKDSVKFKLPGQPVAYMPSGMDRVVVEKTLDVSPKALFHVMFGDRSAVWQLLYHERQAQRIRQGSWAQLKQGHQRREFEFQVEHHDAFGRLRPATVVDSQMIDVSNDHLCYVVTDKKTPWHLPYSQDFYLVSKVVITHVAKSKCKLAIYTKVDWTKPPGFARKIVTSRALHDLGLDALDLADVINDQVKKLGAQSRTKKAIQIFGLIGQQTQVSEFTGSDLPLISRTRRTMQSRTLASLYLWSLSNFVDSCLALLLTRAVALIQWALKTVNANRILLGLLVVSVMANLLFSSSRTSEWWRERKAGQFMARMGVGPNLRMSKAIYLHDLYDAAVEETAAVDTPGNSCFETFLKLVGSMDADPPYTSAEASYFESSGKATARRLRQTRQEMGSHRHDLFVALRVINSIEREMVQAEWEHWLVGETRQCHRLGRMIRENQTDALEANEKDAHDGLVPRKSMHNREIRAWHESYCESCSHQRIRQLRGTAGSSERPGHRE